MLVQFAGSLVAILFVAGLVAFLKLGAQPPLKNKTTLCLIASEVEDGFEVARHSISRAGDAALARDTGGRIMVIKRHGNKLAGRVLSSAATAKEEVDTLIVDAGEKWFGAVRLRLEDAPYWADAINRL